MQIDMRRILTFIGLAFGIAWLTGLAVYLTGGLTNGLKIGGAVPLALILLAVPYMWAPALANILTRLLTREGWRDVGLRPHFKKGWPYWLIAWVLPGLLTVGGAALFFLLFPSHFDPSLALLRRSLAQAPLPAGISIWVIVALGTVAVILSSPILNSLATLGEELGWRAYLLPKLLPLGWRRALLLLGVIWGV